ncbi:MAG: acyl-CoA dehydrogenase [Steroidobacteraceae bacterium]|nr:acyl-CoA dehydrogenase [Steroidobacteraceae bacterium]
MSALLPSRRELDFQLFEVLDAGALAGAPRFADHDRATFDGVLDGAWRLAVERFAPHAALADVEEPQLRGHEVWLPAPTRDALRAAADAGYFAAPFDASLGGLQLPWSVAQAANAVFAAANVGFYGYALLTVGAANLLAAHGSPAQVERYVRPMVAGRWFGTMCLSEPQAGSSLADVRTAAVRAPDGTWRVTGSKMWISGGEHELADNIVHLVLARVSGGPPGVKGLSLFVVPKFRLRDDGTPDPQARNGVRCIGLNHKMGWRGTVNTVLAFGDQGDCVGELVGEEHAGLRIMFHMMNEARIGVGLCATALGCAGYVAALDYARHRPQGRPLGERDPASAPVPILRHADVRRMLLAQKAWVEGALSLVLYCARLVDERRIALDAGDAAAAREHEGLLELLTPVAKSWPSEYCLEANKLAIQVHGGYGYTRDYPVERLYRDNRLNAIHEGTLGIHGLDVLGRKVRQDGGAAFAALGRRIASTVQAAAAEPELAPLARQLGGTFDRLAATTRRLVAAVRDVGPERALANATPYLDALGQVVVAWRWLEQARVALAARPATPGEAAFHAGKRAAARYFFRYELPRVGPTLELLDSLDDTALAMPDDGW